jgi:hypothetical protein
MSSDIFHKHLEIQQFWVNQQASNLWILPSNPQCSPHSSSWSTNDLHVRHGKHYIDTLQTSSLSQKDDIHSPISSTSNTFLLVKHRSRLAASKK